MQIHQSLSTRRGSRTSSQAPSPSLHPTGSAQPSSAIDPAHASYSSEWSGLGGGNESGQSGQTGQGRRGSRDESAFYQAEAAMLARENQMLRMRIRELERQIAELSTNQSANSGSEATSQEPQEQTTRESTTQESTAEEAPTAQAELADEAEKT